jgi:hypothetical protein
MKTQKTLKTFALLLFISLMASFSSLGQFDQMKDKMEDALLEFEEDIFTLRFFDAVNGRPVADAQILIENVGDYKTDEEGKVQFPRQPDGILRVLFKKDRYISSVFEIEVIVQTIFFNRFSVSPSLNIEQFRVVLDWDKQPSDLDAHFIKDGGYHISYRNTRVLADGTGMLDIDDMDGYGPETITVARIDASSNYTYMVHNYSAQMNSMATPLSRSKATVRVYGNNRLLNSFQVSQGHSGDSWTVFKVVNGQVVRP